MAQFTYPNLGSSFGDYTSAGRNYASNAVSDADYMAWQQMPGNSQYSDPQALVSGSGDQSGVYNPATPDPRAAAYDQWLNAMPSAQRNEYRTGLASHDAAERGSFNKQALMGAAAFGGLGLLGPALFGASAGSQAGGAAGLSGMFGGGVPASAGANSLWGAGANLNAPYIAGGINAPTNLFGISNAIGNAPYNPGLFATSNAISNAPYNPGLFDVSNAIGNAPYQSPATQLPTQTITGSSQAGAPDMQALGVGAAGSGLTTGDFTRMDRGSGYDNGNPIMDFISKQFSPSNNVGRIGSNLLDMYNNYQKKKRNQGMINNLSSLYGPNSPYAQQLNKALTRAYAASGRRSDVGGRNVELQARLAAVNAQLAPTLNTLNNQQGGFDNGFLNNIVRFGDQSGLTNKIGTSLASLWGG